MYIKERMKPLVLALGISAILNFALVVTLVVFALHCKGCDKQTVYPETDEVQMDTYDSNPNGASRAIVKSELANADVEFTFGDEVTGLTLDRDGNLGALRV